MRLCLVLNHLILNHVIVREFNEKNVQNHLINRIFYIFVFQIADKTSEASVFYKFSVKSKNILSSYIFIVPFGPKLVLITS